MAYIVAKAYHDIFNFIKKSNTLFIDTETDGLKPYHGNMPFSLQIGYLDTKDILYIPLRHTKNQMDMWCLCDEPFLELFKEALENKELVAHNAKFDLHMLNSFFREYLGIDFEPKKVICTLHFTKILFLDIRGASLNELSFEFNLPLKADIGLGKKEKYDEVAFEKMVSYGCRDIYVLQHLYNYLLNEVKCMNNDIRNGFIQYLPYELSSTLELYYMEKTGVLLSHGKLEDAKKILEALYSLEKKAFFDMAGMDFVGSGKSIQKAFNQFDIILPTKEKTNNPMADEEILEQVNHPLAKIILNIRGYEKLLKTYVYGFEKAQDKNGIIHCSFNPVGAITGRMSCASPNLQNIPRTDKPVNLRSIVTAPENFDIVSIDFAQQELRIIFDLANEEELIKNILKGEDIHETNAHLAGIQRQDAKNMIFGILYGEGVTSLAIQTGKSFKDAGILLNKIKKGLPKTTQYMKLMTEFSSENKFVMTPFMVKIPIVPQFAYKSTNAVIQGTAANITKKWLVKCSSFFRTHDTYKELVFPCLVIHDEICFYVSQKITTNEDEMKKFMIIIKQFALESSWGTNKVHMDCDAKILGRFWKKG